MKKILYFTWFLFFCSAVSLIAQSSPDPTPAPTPTPPPANHYVGDDTSLTSIPSGVGVLEYCAFLRTKAAHESFTFSSDYWDSVFMSTSTIKLNSKCCIIRTGSNGAYTYSVPAGRENYVIMGLTSQSAFDQFNQWKKNPKAIEMRDYINNKIAEQLSNQATYADQAYDIRGSYLQCSPVSFFDDLDALADELVNTPADFDAAGRATFCLADSEAGESLLYFDHVAGAEGLESANGFLGLPAKMGIYVHLYDEDLYSPYYRPNAVTRTQLVSTN